jgi:hypothetical protein
MFSNKYQKLITYFEKNKDKPWNEWLKYDKLLDNQGKQGMVGLFKLTDENEEETTRYIFKLSQNLNYLVYHELTVMQGLSSISNFCPFFCKGIGSIKCKVEPKRKIKNPFDIKSKYPIEKEVLLCEYIENSSKFYNYIKTKDIKEEMLYSIVKQVLMGINIAQQKKQFTHYDLHSNNVMIKKCNKDLVFIFKYDDDNQFAIPTLGYYPIIIDYGFAYISDMEDKPLWTSLAHTEVGFMSDRFDWVADPKLFLITVSDEIKDKRNTPKSKKFRRIVRNLFYPLKIDVECGWDDDEDKSAADYVLEMLDIENNTSKIFKDFDYYCIDILQSLIILPLQEQDYSNIGKSFKAFLKEWSKIENEISNEFYNIYILKEVVNIARNIRPEYLKKETRADAITIFQKNIYKAINKVSAFCNPKNINFEKFLCSLLLLAENIEGMLYEVITTRMAEKQKQYNKLPLQSLEQIYAAIDVNIKDTYTYNKDTVFCIIDVENETNDLFKIPEDEVENINEINNLSKGCYVYDLYKKS